MPSPETLPEPSAPSLARRTRDLMNHLDLPLPDGHFAIRVVEHLGQAGTIIYRDDPEQRPEVDVCIDESVDTYPAHEVVPDVHDPAALLILLYAIANAWGALLVVDPDDRDWQVQAGSHKTRAKGSLADPHGAILELERACGIAA